MPSWWRGRSREHPPHDAGSAVRRALLAVLDRDLERAERLLGSLVQKDSGELEVYLALARLFRQRGEVGRAIHVHQNLLLRRDVGPALRLQALLGLADDFRSGGFLRRAIAAYREVLEEQPDHPRALRTLVELLADADEPREAIPLARRLARVERRDAGPAEARLWAQAAEIERGAGRAEAARKALRRALRRDPGCVRAWLALGEVEAELGRTRRALGAFRRAVSLDRRAGPRAYPQLAALAASLGRAGEHEAWLRARLEEQPDDREARLALAAVLAGRGAVEQAEAELRVALKREPDALAAHVALGRLLLAEGRAEAAAKAHDELLGVLERRARALAPHVDAAETDPFA